MGSEGLAASVRPLRRAPAPNVRSRRCKGVPVGFRLHRSVQVIPGLRLNFSKSGLGVSTGVKGYHVSHMANGRTRRTISIPGTGMSWITEKSHAGAGRPRSASTTPQATSPSRPASAPSQARLARAEARERPLPGAAHPGPRHHRAPRRDRARGVPCRGHHRRAGAPDLRPGRRRDHRAPAGVRHRQGPRGGPVHHQVRDVADLARARRGGHRRPHDRPFDDRPPAGRAAPAEVRRPIAPSRSSSSSSPPR